MTEAAIRRTLRRHSITLAWLVLIGTASFMVTVIEALSR